MPGGIGAAVVRLVGRDISMNHGRADNARCRREAHDLQVECIRECEFCRGTRRHFPSRQERDGLGAFAYPCQLVAQDRAPAGLGFVRAELCRIEYLVTSRAQFMSRSVERREIHFRQSGHWPSEINAHYLTSA